MMACREMRRVILAGDAPESDALDRGGGVAGLCPWDRDFIIPLDEGDLPLVEAALFCGMGTCREYLTQKAGRLGSELPATHLEPPSRGLLSEILARADGQVRSTSVQVHEGVHCPRLSERQRIASTRSRLRTSAPKTLTSLPFPVSPPISLGSTEDLSRDREPSEREGEDGGEERGDCPPRMDCMVYSVGEGLCGARSVRGARQSAKIY